MLEYEKQIQEGVQTAFIDSNINSNLAYRPQFISNNYKIGQKVVSSIEEELKNCEEFFISVAFITKGGITPLLQTLKELEKRGVPGKILTTDYLKFSEPEALKRLSSLRNIELRMYRVNENEAGFHTKGYIFKSGGTYKIIMGSSNMTLSALTRNKEWNTKIISTGQGEYVTKLWKEFEELWNESTNIDTWIDTYTQIYKEQKKITAKTKIPHIENYQLKPNSMQVSFVENLQKIREKGESRALLISATGTGKTYASAFALRHLGVQKALFIVHREQIAKQAIKSYRNVYGDTKKTGLVSGNAKEFEADYLFATMQTMSKDETLCKFSPDEFEVIVIDEVHRAGAQSYQKIMKYFNPQFWLGMTASPERPDGFDIYRLFHHNIAYEIRLQQALEEDLLCPFHYFGITDLEIQGETFNDASGVQQFNLLVSKQRVDYIIEKAEYYGYSGERVKGLIFCSRKEEAYMLSEQFNQHGYQTVALTGEDHSQKREEVVERLVTDDLENKLDYIFTVDIFNEGVDIPEVNQVIMLRPTESPIIFIQQLGRGLRKSEGKEYVVILDFIGNYMNNFMIPIALSGDRTYNKDSIRKYVMEGEKIIPGSSSIHFDEISKKRIFASIDKMSTTKKMLRDQYLSLKNKIGRIPTILDFYDYGEIDPMLFIEYADTYHRFLTMVDKEYNVKLSEEEYIILEFISKMLVNGKRPHELLILKELLTKEKADVKYLEKELQKSYDLFEQEESLNSAFYVLQGKFINAPSDKKKYAHMEIFRKTEDNFLERVESWYRHLQHREFYVQLNQLIELGLKRYKDNYKKNMDEDGLSLYQKYSRKDVCRLLNWEKDDSSTIYGYKIKNQTCPIFVTYEKKEEIANSTKYEDRFLNNKEFSWMTRSRVSLESSEAQSLIHYKEKSLKLYLFIKKSDGEGTDFYYMGKVFPKSWRETTILNDTGKALPIMNFVLELEHEVRNDIYDYFTS